MVVDKASHLRLWWNNVCSCLRDKPICSPSASLDRLRLFHGLPFLRFPCGFRLTARRTMLLFVDKLTCCHTQTEAADPAFNFTQSQYTDTGPTSPSADPITPGSLQGSHWSANFYVTGMTLHGKKTPWQAGFIPRVFGSRGGHLNH